MKLNELSPSINSVKNRKRIGRGVSSGQGKTAGKGSKGYNARSGGGVRPGWEGGQMPIHRRLPKRGFVNIFKTFYTILNLSDLANLESVITIDPVNLAHLGLIKNSHSKVKILGNGEITKNFNFKNVSISKNAKNKIEIAGGKIED